MTEHVGINPLLNAGAASGVPTGVTRRSGVDGLIAAVPGIYQGTARRWIFSATVASVRGVHRAERG